MRGLSIDYVCRFGSIGFICGKAGVLFGNSGFAFSLVGADAGFTAFRSQHVDINIGGHAGHYPFGTKQPSDANVETDTSSDDDNEVGGAQEMLSFAFGPVALLGARFGPMRLHVRYAYQFVVGKDATSEYFLPSEDTVSEISVPSPLANDHVFSIGMGFWHD